MNIAIVDDEKIELEAAENYLRNYLTENWSELNFVIQTFSSANDFLKIFYSCGSLSQRDLKCKGNFRAKSDSLFIKVIGNFSAFCDLI